MNRAPTRPFVLIVVDPANDRGGLASVAAYWRIRWLRTGSIGRSRRS